MAAEIPDGAFLVARAIFNSSLWTMGNEDRILAITCIGLANWKPRKIWIDGKEVEIKRGQFLRSLDQLTEASRLSKKNVRTSLNHLISAQFLAREAAGVSFIYTVCKYDRYQDLTKYADSEWPDAAQQAAQQAAQGRHRDGTTPAQRRHEGGTKQESYKRDDGEKGEEHTLKPAKATAHNHTVAAHLVSVWNRGPGFAIGHEAGQKLVKAYIASGVDAQKIEEAISNQATCAGKKLFEVLEPFRKKPGNGIPSIQEILDNFAKGDKS